MMSAMLLIAAWVAALSGAALVALGKPAHRLAVTGSSLPRGGRGVLPGWALLLLCLILAVLRDGWGMGLLLGPLLIAGGLATVIVILATRPRLLRILARSSAGPPRP